MKKRVAVLVAAPEMHLEISVEILMSLYQLTRAEAKLVSSLVKDRSLNTIAEDFGISKHTIRNQLKSVYEKTGTHRQAELVRQVISGPAMLATIFKSEIAPFQHTLTSTPWRDTARSESPRLHQTMRLPDGRVLGYAEYGNLKGNPALLMHASNGSRLERHPDETIIEKCNVHLIVPDRPGVGLSDRKKSSNLMEWTRDVECLADHLGLEKFSVIGYSSGGAFGSACAYRLKDRVRRLILVAGITPFESVWELEGMYKPIRLIMSLGKYAPSLLEPLLRLFRFRITPEIWQYELWRNLPPVDQALMYDAAFKERVMENTRESLRQGGFLVPPEVLVVSKEWGFRLEDIEVPSEIWHGELDSMVPVKMARRLSEKIPNCQTNFLPGVGHYILFYCWKEILLSAVSES